jgi:hypothetical protein
MSATEKHAMAGGWIKVSEGLWDKPQVVRFAPALNSAGREGVAR